MKVHVRYMKRKIYDKVFFIVSNITGCSSRYLHYAQNGTTNLRNDTERAPIPPAGN